MSSTVHARSPDRAPPGSEAPPRQEMAAAGLKAFFAITSEWGLTRDEQRRLLGNPGRSRFYDMARSNRGNLSDDELDRLSYISGIYSALNILYNQDNTLRWLKHPGEAGSIWRGASPLDYMLTSGLVAFSDVRRYLDALRG